MSGSLVSLLLLVVAGAVAWIALLRRQIAHLRSTSRQAQREQETVLSLIDKLGEKITSKIDLGETLRIITEYIVQATKAESGAIFLVAGADHGEAGTLRASVVVGPFPPLHMAAGPLPPAGVTTDEQVRRAEIPIGRGIIGLVAEQGEPLLVTDAEADPRVPREATLLSRIHSLMLCPLRVRGRVLGVFAVVNKRGAPVFDSRDMAMLQALTDQAAITVDLVKLYDVLAEQQRLEQELAIAHEFQKMLLPETFPKAPGYEFHASSEAALVVGGDFYDFFEVDEGQLGLVIADVSGKGIPGALIMAMTRAVLRAEARGCRSPRETLRRVNERMLSDTTESVFITMVYGVLDLERRVLRFVRAGHEPLLVLETGDGEAAAVGQVSPEGIALGLVGGALFDNNQEAEIQLRPGEIVILYTDGVIEAMDQGGREYGRARLLARLAAARVPTARGLIEDVLADIHQFTLGIPQHDDITLLALRAPLADEAPDEGQAARPPAVAAARHPTAEKTQ